MTNQVFEPNMIFCSCGKLVRVIPSNEFVRECTFTFTNVCHECKSLEKTQDGIYGFGAAGVDAMDDPKELQDATSRLFDLEKAVAETDLIDAKKSAAINDGAIAKIARFVMVSIQNVRLVFKRLFFDDGKHDGVSSPPKSIT